MSFLCKKCDTHIKESDPCIEVTKWISGWKSENNSIFYCQKCWTEFKL
jgi:hypothetical protein